MCIRDSWWWWPRVWVTTIVLLYHRAGQERRRYGGEKSLQSLIIQVLNDTYDTYGSSSGVESIPCCIIWGLQGMDCCGGQKHEFDTKYRIFDISKHNRNIRYHPTLRLYDILVYWSSKTLIARAVNRLCLPILKNRFSAQTISDISANLACDLVLNPCTIKCEWILTLSSKSERCYHVWPVKTSSRFADSDLNRSD